MQLTRGYVLGNSDVDHPSALDSTGGGHWSMEDPLFQAAAALNDDEEELLIRHARAAEDETTETPAQDEDKSLWEKIEDFYADNNNMAMYCVLPIMVLVYGGCSAIYCIYKCRRYLRRRKHKRLRNEDDTNSLAADERNDLNQNGDLSDGADRQPVKTVSGGTWDDANSSFTDVRYNVERKKTPLPWDTPQKAAPVIGVAAAAASSQMHRQDSFSENEDPRPRDGNYSATSRDSSSMALERERDKLEQRLDGKGEPPKPGPKPGSQDRVENFMNQKKMEEMRGQRQDNVPNRPINKASDFSRFAGSRPIEIVPITKAEYQRHMESNQTADIWDPLHNRPFDSRNSTEPERSRNGRESSWSIRDEIMAKYDALTSLAMTKKTAEVLRVNADNNTDDGGHYPDTLRRKQSKKHKLIFIAE
nr:hypothetical protein BaRGS_019149 [Batillaria attramentaria]